MPRSPSAPPRVQRRQKPPETPPQPSGIAAGAAGGALGAAAGGAAGAVPALALARTARLPLEGLLSALEEFFPKARLHVGRVVGEATKGMLPDSEIAAVIARETELGAEFERKARERVQVEWAKIQALPETDRPEAYRALLETEKRYAGQRAEAVAWRAIRAVERVAVKRESPVGALWVLGPADKHTPDCVAMAGKVWPWEVLDREHPPLGPGCVCALLGVPAAIVQGLVPANVQPVRDAVRARERIKTVYGVHGGLKGLREAEDMRRALIESGLASEEQATRAVAEWLKGRADA